MENVNKERRFFLSLSELECSSQEINSRETRPHFTFSVNWNKRDKVWKNASRFKSGVFAAVAIVDAKAPLLWRKVHFVCFGCFIRLFFRSSGQVMAIWDCVVLAAKCKRRFCHCSQSICGSHKALIFSFLRSRYFQVAEDLRCSISREWRWLCFALIRINTLIWDIAAKLNSPPPPDLNTVLCQTNTNAGYVHTLYQSFCLHEIRKCCQIKTDHFLVVIDFKVSLINRFYCNLRGWRRKGRGGEGGEKGEGILTFSFSDNFYLALQCFF